jgi:hypothetical protein
MPIPLLDQGPIYTLGGSVYFSASVPNADGNLNGNLREKFIEAYQENQKEKCMRITGSRFRRSIIDGS